VGDADGLYDLLDQVFPPYENTTREFVVGVAE
jgi:hypothetical protein